MSDELLDIFDEDMNPIGAKPRSEVHRLGYWHKSFQCWIVGQRGESRYVVFQQRSAEKRTYPNVLDITAAGHLRHGETIQDGARELEEELGVRPSYRDLVPLGTRCEVVRAGNVLDREQSETFLYRDDRDLQEFRIDAREIAGLVAVDLDDGMRLFAGEVPAIDANGVLVSPSGPRRIERRITCKDAFPRFAAYYMKVFIMAERYLEGRRYLGI